MTRAICFTLLLSTVCLVATTLAQDKPTLSVGKTKIADLEYVKMTTSMGDIVIELNRHKAPITVTNFLAYADDGAYNGTIFHRVLSDFVIQGGGMDEKLVPIKTKPPIKNEWKNGLKNALGTISMARFGGKPDSATSQFFISVKDNRSLDTPRDGAAYAVFGRVIDGMDVVNKIKVVETKKNSRGEKCLPVEAIFITAVTRVEASTLTAQIEAANKAEQARIEAAQKIEAERQKKQEEAKKKTEQAMAEQFNQALEFVKGKGGDPTKGVKSDTGLWHVDTVTGEGETPKPTDKVQVHYTGWLANGSKFDSSVDRGTPFDFSLSGGVIKGWLEGVASMKVGSTRFLVIPPDLGYGARGSGAKIPPNSVLVFEVQLLAIK
jgi:FKBP-type peptidyl-prolyl cis-trans isomerase